MSVLENVTGISQGFVRVSSLSTSYTSYYSIML